MKNFKIADKEVGSNCPTFIIAEVAQAHEGSLGIAFSYVDALATTGVDAVKFQTHIAQEESTARDQWRVSFSVQDKSRYDYWKRMEFTEEQWLKLANYTRSKGLIFLSSPFSIKSVEILEKAKVPAWKIGSGEIRNTLLLDIIEKTNKPILLSTGLCSFEEMTSLHAQLRAQNTMFALLHCTSEYPVSEDKIGFNILEKMLAQYDCPIGFSSHAPNPAISFAAAIKGACVLENHVVFSRNMFGPDSTSSLTIDEFSMLVKMIRQYEKIISHPVDKDADVESKKNLITLFEKSIVASRPLSQNTILTLDCLGFKKPGGGLKVSDHKKILGKKLKKDLEQDELILLDNLD